MSAPALEVMRLSKSFGGHRAVDDVSFAIAPGDIVALIGPNGAGKTTTFNLINGQLSPDAGAVHIDGRDTTGQAPRRLVAYGVGRTFQISATFLSMTVLENVVVAATAQQGGFGSMGWPSRASEQNALGVLGDVGLRAAAGNSASRLAYADLKRLELAIALAGTPRLLLMDEPTAGMAGSERKQLMQLTARLASERGATVLFTEHDMDVVFGHARRILVMHRGRLIADGTPADIRANALVRDAYLGATAEPSPQPQPQSQPHSKPLPGGD